MIAIPRGEREGAAGDPEVIVGQRAEQLAQRDRIGAVGGGLAVAEQAREAGGAVELSEVQRAARDRPARDLRLASAGLVRDAQ